MHEKLHALFYARYYINAELNKFKKHTDDFTYDQKLKEMEDALKNVWEHKRSLIMTIDKLTKVDGYNEWREKEAKDLSNLVQRRFRCVTQLVIILKFSIIHVL